MAESTRSKTSLYLLGSEETCLTGSKLPSKRQVLSVFFHHHKTLKKTIRESSTAVIKEVEIFWERARIPVKDQRNSIPKLEGLFNTWTKLKKNSKRKTERQLKNEENFTYGLEDLFDIAHENALKIMKIQEDIDFLICQRKRGRPGCMTHEDRLLAEKEDRTFKRQDLFSKQQRKEQMRIENQSILIRDSDEASSDEALMSVPNQGESATGNEKPKRKRARKTVVTKDLVATLDRTNISDRKATFLLRATAQSLGYDTQDVVINRSSVQRSRRQLRAELANDIFENFHDRRNGPLVVHWDGKLLPDITGKEKVDRLPVIVSGAEGDQLLGVPKLQAGTGEAQASAVVELLTKWKLVNRVKAMCFDTTSSNTGKFNGACMLLERKIGKELLHLACRHHIMEIILSSVFSVCLGPACSPDIPLFKRLQKEWCSFDHTIFKSGLESTAVCDALETQVDSVSQFAESQLRQEKQPREDYRELLELVIIFLGEIPPRGVKFRAPGGFSNARWMVKAIYCLKIWMFRAQFKLTAREEKGVRDICIFVIRVYVRAWFTAPLATCAPRNDLTLLQELYRYKEVNSLVSNAAIDKLSRHLWYLSEELVALGFFDLEVSNDCKRKMVFALREREGNEKAPKRVEVKNVNSYIGKEIDIFVTKKSITLFQSFGISTEFLDADPETWHRRDDFQQSRRVIKALRVVNDNAERGVALIQDFNKSITKSEEQKQYLLLVVQEHRKKFPQCKK